MGAACAAAVLAGGAWLVRRKRRPHHPDLELELSPLTGAPVSNRIVIDELDTSSNSAPVARAVTKGSADVRADPAVAQVAVAGAGRLAPTQLPATQRAQLLAAAWRSKDVEGLAALAAAGGRGSNAALVLAAHCGLADADPRTGAWLARATGGGYDPARDADLAPFLAELSAPLHVDGWPELDVQLPCSRQSLGLISAAWERAAGDLDMAYGVLLDLEDAPRVRALRGLVAAELGWWTRAARAVQDLQVDDAWVDPLLHVRVLALAHEGLFADALVAADDRVSRLESRGVTSQRLLEAVFARARVRAQMGDLDGAWADLTRVAQLDPNFPGLAQALKQL